MELHLHIGEENVGPLSADEVKAKYASGEVGPDTLAWMDGMDTWYPLSHDNFATLGLTAALTGLAPEAESAQEATAQSDAAGTDAPVGATLEPELSPEPAPAAEAPASEPAPVTEPVAGEGEEPAVEPAPEPAPESESVPAAEPVASEGEPEPDPVEIAATSAAFDAATAFEPRSREELKDEMIRLKQEHANVLLPEIGRKAVEEGIRVSGATEILNRIETLLKKGDSSQLQAAYVSYAQAIVQTGASEPSLDELIEKERQISEAMLNLHTEARKLGAPNKPGGALKWILLLLALLAVAGAAALIFLSN